MTSRAIFSGVEMDGNGREEPVVQIVCQRFFLVICVSTIDWLNCGMVSPDIGST